jgi:exopolysaccharide biosynthesis predicted pyruvyltransferase EpsI
MDSFFCDLADAIVRASKGRPVYYIPNAGNWGDALIREGTLCFFDKFGIRYVEVENYKKWRRRVFLKRLRRGVVIYGGGGGWCTLWHHSSMIVTDIPKYFKIMVMPSTYEQAYSISNTVFYRRDEYESKEFMPDAHFCHDMAFCIGRKFYTGNPGEGTGCFFREDAESSRLFNLPPGNVDLSLQGSHMSDVKPFFDAIDRFSVVHTDRLHVSIAASLLGKEVHLYPNSYFKNKSVYLSSLHGRYERVFFHEPPFSEEITASLDLN